MSLSWFVLALYVLLESLVYLALVTVDGKLIGFVGLAFVIIVVVEQLLGRNLLPARR